MTLGFFLTFNFVTFDYNILRSLDLSHLSIYSACVIMFDVFCFFGRGIGGGGRTFVSVLLLIGCVESDREFLHCLAGSIKGLEVTNSALLEGAAAAGPPLSTSASVSPPKPYNHRIHAGMSVTVAPISLCLSLHLNLTTITHTHVCL